MNRPALSGRKGLSGIYDQLQYRLKLCFLWQMKIAIDEACYYFLLTL
jgi:hypothetical protein